MHIKEGLLPTPWVGAWFVFAAPFFFWGLRDIRLKSQKDLRYKSVVALVGAAVFIISCMPVPVPIAGTCSHPAGTGLAVLLIGPAATVVVSSIALTLQALFLAHGGLTTLGANLFSMGIAGAFASYGVFLLARRLRVPIFWAAFAAGLTADWITYACTSVELAAAFQGSQSFAELFTTFLIAFSPTQLPLGILEGFLTAIAYQFLTTRLQLGVSQKTEVRDRRSEVRSQKSVFIALLCLSLATPVFCAETPAQWEGVDKTVIEKHAEEAGRKAHEPLINTDKGDLLLFVFLIAGAVGGFIAGYAYRSLASPKQADSA
jgi:cobalt/nickel transport system permease protein